MPVGRIHVKTRATKKDVRFNPLKKPSEQQRIVSHKARQKKAPALSEKGDQYTSLETASIKSSDEKVAQLSKKPTQNHIQKPKRLGMKKKVIVAIVLAGGFISNSIRTLGKHANHTRPNLSYGDLVNHFPQGASGSISHDDLSKLLESSDPKTQRWGALLLGNPSLSASREQAKDGLISINSIKAGDQPFKGIPNTQTEAQRPFPKRKKSSN